jgi:hypothetical protein
VSAVDYGNAHASAIKACEAIAPSESQGGLYFNPDGYRSYYVRSKCFQEAAVLFRDAALCDQVKERRSLLASSWGYTVARCRQLVTEGTAADRAELERLKAAYAAGGITLRDVRVERNGNGRDFDLIPGFTGAYAHGYTLTFEIVPNAPAPPVLLHTSRYHLDEQTDLRIYIRQVDIQQRFTGFSVNRAYAVRATVTLDVGDGGPAGYWSPAFIDSVFPTRERSQSIIRQLTF